MSNRAMTIGALAKATGATAETIRFYERNGLLPLAPRTAGNYRSYGTEDVRRLGFIRRARDLGFPLDTVRALLDLADRPEEPCGAVDGLVREQLAVIERKIADLDRLRTELERLSGICPGERRVADCRILESLLD
jgi:DNA-binding transcriptional MerR regulator